MTELDDLYQAVILAHDREPHNYGRIAAPSGGAEAYNPLCGDRLYVTLELADEHVGKVMFDATGCAIARASASLMTDFIVGRSLADVRRLAKALEAALRDRKGPAFEAGSELAALAALSGVRRFPSRIRCAMLAWYALLEALTTCAASA
jgi:nitrogen fixation NifU-like protein